MRKTRLLIALILCLMFATVSSPAPASAQEKVTYTNVLIYEDDYESHSLFGLSKDEKIDISVDVTSPSGGLIDVYILSSSQYSSYPEGVFTPTVAKERISSTDFTFKAPDDASYYLVIDNVDNSRSDDADPTGDVTVSYEYDHPLYAVLDDVEGAIWTGVMLCILGLVIIVVIIVVVIVLVLRSGKKDKPPAQPYPPQQPYQQQPYQQPYQQQPYQQPYQPPPGEQPYQPPPGEQPPPQ